nr:immunoglobulin heavy chain junction region [Macaca mulatta]MOV54341.1 immunoglobulin heavy chain junction region [Macaca mulatta]MOV54995.1 immunoglobulin heavy chain junction region [Macaca mulatta]MOV56129.1 immunoglobulin heavy chain junction region [Macaca mulatta]MOV56235.1 immunoglobulin heavy chain junction region [Macaca mulatta]
CARFNWGYYSHFDFW